MKETKVPQLDWRKQKRWPVTVSFNCSQEMYAWLKAHSGSGSISGVVRRILVDYVRRQEVSDDE